MKRNEALVFEHSAGAIWKPAASGGEHPVVVRWPAIGRHCSDFLQEFAQVRIQELVFRYFGSYTPVLRFSPRRLYIA